MYASQVRTSWAKESGFPDGSLTGTAIVSFSGTADSCTLPTFTASLLAPCNSVVTVSVPVSFDISFSAVASITTLSTIFRGGLDIAEEYEMIPN
jgi:hypothetical protein